MADGTFRSNSSASTNLYVNIYEIWRSGTTVGMRVDWRVTTGAGSSLGNNTSNWRNLIITHVNGTVLTQATIKGASATWNTSSTYSGSWDFSFDTGNYNANTQSMIPSTNATGTQSCIWTTYVSQLDVAVSGTWSAIGAPGITNISPVCFENSIRFDWNAASDGNNNAVTGYSLFYNINGSGFVGIGVGLATSYDLSTAGVDRGASMSFYVTAYDSHGSSASTGTYSGYYKNRVPYAPTSASVPKTSYIPGETIRVSFANNGDVDGNASYIQVRRTIDNATVFSVAGSGGVSYADIDTTGWAQGMQTAFQVRLVDAYEIASGWSNNTAIVTLNTAPNVSEISFPVENSTVYNRKPHILLKAGTVNDGPKNILCLNDGTEKTTAVNGTVFSCGTADALTSAQQVVYLPPSDFSIGGAGISSRMYDSFLYSSSVLRIFTVAGFAPTDADLTITGMKIKASHISDLRTAVNNIRAAYGLAAAVWTTLTAGTTSIGNAIIITELQTALQVVIDKINGWASGSTFDISITWVSPAASGGGVERVKLRQAIEQIRTTIPLI